MRPDAVGRAEAARRALMEHGFRFTHSLGQNFLLDEGIIARVADAADVGAGDNVLEIGAGAGMLTAELAGRGARVVALEIDRALEPVLQDMLRGEARATVVFADALKADLATLTQDAFAGAPFKVVANLPYYITADILIKLLTAPLPLVSVTVMVQKEAAERVMASPGQKVYSALAATVQYFGRPQACFHVGPRAFTPPPHVDSVLMRIDVYREKPVQARDDAAMLRVINAAFAMRRKTLVNNLSAAFALSKPDATALLAALHIDPAVRGEALPLADLACIADALAPSRPMHE